MKYKPIYRRDVLIKALFHHKGCSGLCRALCNQLENIAGKGTYYLENVFPLYTLHNAREFGAGGHGSYWWKVDGWNIFHGRVRFLIWLILKYWDDKSDLKKELS